MTEIAKLEADLAQRLEMFDNGDLSKAEYLV
jgi:hypothetical protein